MQLYAGMKVRVIASIDEVPYQINGVNINSDMRTRANELMTIESVSEGDHVRVVENSWLWARGTYFVDPNENEMPLFKRGDFVTLKPYLRVGRTYGGIEMTDGLRKRFKRRKAFRVTGITVVDGSIHYGLRRGGMQLSQELLQIYMTDEQVFNGWECHDCGKIHHGTSDMFITGDGFICRECASENYHHCENCGCWHKKRTSTRASGGQYCRECAREVLIHCETCNEYVRSWDVMEAPNGERMCNSCIYEHYRQCYECGNFIEIDESVEFSGDYYCNECYENRSVIGGYGHTEADHFYKLDGEETDKYFGIELEVESIGCEKNKGAISALEILGENFIECKYDGSLSDGFEIATQPATLAYHMQKDYKTAFSQLAFHDLRSHDVDTCGLHVHVSRKALRDEYNNANPTIARMIVMLDKIWDDVVTFSRREYDGLDQWAKKNKSKSLLEDCNVNDIIEDNAYARYQAINIRNNATVEFRFFKGTLNTNTFLASLEWVDLFTEYAKNHDMETCYNAKWKDIFAGASDNFNNYCHKLGIDSRITEIKL